MRNFEILPNDSNHAINNEKIITFEEEPQNAVTAANNKLRRSLGFYDGMGVVISIMIGSGIFASPGVALEKSGSPGATLLTWCLSGVLVLIASFCYAELGSMLPSAGGDYEYLIASYGDSAGFMFAWYYFWISKPGSQAIIATVFGDYILIALTGNKHIKNVYYSKLCSILLIVLLVAINCFGIKENSIVVNLLTIWKLFLVFMISLSGLIFCYHNNSIITQNLQYHSSFDDTNIYGIGPAMIACLWAYDGWADLNFLCEELKNPTKILPRVLWCGVMVVMGCYVVTNTAYFSVLEKDIIATSHTVGLEFGYAVGHNIGCTLMALGVAICTAGSANGSIMTGGRAFYAIARKGQAPSLLAHLNKWGSPYTSLLAQGGWCIILLLLPGSSFSSLLSYTGPAAWLFYAFTGSAVIVLRYKQPNAVRPFLVPCYPLPPIILIIMAMYLCISSIISQPFFCLLSMSFVICAVPVWWLVKRYKGISGNNDFIDLKENSSHATSFDDSDVNDIYSFDYFEK